MAKKKLAKSFFLITECLTKERQSCIKILNELRKKKQIFSFWTMDGKIHFIKELNSQKHSIASVIKQANMV